MSRKRCKRVIRRSLAPTLVALHLNPEVCLQERGAVLAVRGGWATTDHFNVLAACRDMLMLAANERDDKSAIAAGTSALEAMIAEAGEVMRERCAAEVDWILAEGGKTQGDKLRALPGVTMGDLR